MATKRSIDKQLLSNFIKHANSHNKIQEERDMWHQREIEKKRDRFCDDWSFRASMNISPMIQGHLISDVLDHSPSSSPSPPPHSHYIRSTQKPHPPEPSHSYNYYTRQLMKAEESDPFRWGHSGYKEQHPEEFSSPKVKVEKKTKKKKKKKRKNGETLKKSKHKLKRSEVLSDSEEEDEKWTKCSSSKRRHRTSKLKRRLSSSSESTGSSHHDKDITRRRKKRLKQKTPSQQLSLTSSDS